MDKLDYINQIRIYEEFKKLHAATVTTETGNKIYDLRSLHYEAT